MGSSHSVLDTVFEMKMRSKEMSRLSVKCEKEEQMEKDKVKKAIQKGNKDGARVYAQNAIRKKHEALCYLQLSSKMDAVASRLEAASRQQQLTKSMCKAVPGLSSAMKSLDIDQVSTTMDQFSRLFEDLDVRGAYVSSAIETTTVSSTPVDQVDELITRVGEEHALDVSDMLSNAPTAALGPPQRVKEGDVDALQARLNRL